MEELNIIKQALEAAQAKGTFSMKDSHTIYEIVGKLENKLESIENNKTAMKEPSPLVAEEVKA